MQVASAVLALDKPMDDTFTGTNPVSRVATDHTPEGLVVLVSCSSSKVTKIAEPDACSAMTTVTTLVIVGRLVTIPVKWILHTMIRRRMKMMTSFIPDGPITHRVTGELEFQRI